MAFTKPSQDVIKQKWLRMTPIERTIQSLGEKKQLRLEKIQKYTKEIEAIDKALVALLKALVALLEVAKNGH